MLEGIKTSLEINQKLETKKLKAQNPNIKEY